MASAVSGILDRLTALALGSPKPTAVHGDRSPLHPGASSEVTCTCSNNSHGATGHTGCCSKVVETSPASPLQAQPTCGKVLFGSENGSTQQLAERFAAQARIAGLQLVVQDVADYELEHLSKEALVVCFISTQQGGQPPERARRARICSNCFRRLISCGG